jgi:flavorubredoxin
MQATKLIENVYWVGAIDWDVRQFHGGHYSTHRGTTYNAYLIVDEKIALIDTVHPDFTEEMMRRIKSVVDPKKIDFLIANHGEIDHSGTLPHILKEYPQLDFITSPKGAESIPAIHQNIKAPRVVKNGDTLSLGKKTLTFLEAPMLHWPDSMFTYLVEDAILFPNDAFGQHIATSHRFNDEVDQKYLMDEAAKYYANILTPFSRLVVNKINEVVEAKIPLKMIAPSHGIIWRDNPLQIVTAYMEWAQGKTKPRVLMVFETMWDSTRKMAHAIAEGIGREGVEVVVYDLGANDRTDVVKELLTAKVLVVGSSTINNGILPHIAPLLSELKGLKFTNRLAAVFGSYGWGGGAIKTIEDSLKQTGFTIVEEGLGIKWVPNETHLTQCIEYGQKIALHAKQ